MIYQTFVAGKPAGWARAGAHVIAGHAAIFERRTGSAAEWKRTLTAHFSRTAPRDPIDVPVSVELHFLFERPKYHRGERGLLPSAPMAMTSKPDLDNLVKLVLDAMVGGRRGRKTCRPLILADDNLVVEMHATKEWCPADAHPGCEVIVEAAQ